MGEEAPNVETPPVENGGGEPPKENSGTPPERPDYIPEKFWDAEAGAPNIENLAKSYIKLESTRGDPDKLREEWEGERLKARPESADKYELPEHDALDAEQLAASPVVSLFREIAFEQGMDNEAFQKTISNYADSQIAQIEARLDEEKKALGENADVRLEAVTLWAEKNFKEDELSAIQQVATTAAGVRALEKLMGKGREGGPSLDEGEPLSGDDMTEEQARSLMQDPRYWDNKRRDPEIVKKVQDFFQKKYGEVQG